MNLLYFARSTHSLMNQLSLPKLPHHRVSYNIRMVQPDLGSEGKPIRSKGKATILILIHFASEESLDAHPTSYWS